MRTRGARGARRLEDLVSVSSLCICVVASLGSLVPIQGGPKVWTAPETFVAKAETRSSTGVASVPLAVHIDRYTPMPISSEWRRR